MAITLAEKREQQLTRRINATFDRSRAIVHGALRAPEISEEDIQQDEHGKLIIPRGWSKAELQSAIDARKSRRDAPVYLDIAQKVVELEARLEASRQQPTQLNVGSVNIVQPPSYKVIDVTPKTE